MLKGSFGSGTNSGARAPGGAIQVSMLSSGTRIRSAMKSGPSSAALALSMNRWIAPESFAMPSSCSGEALVVSGAATPPARTAARNTSAYSTVDVPRIATD